MRLCRALGVVWLAAAAPAVASDGDARQAVHDALAAQLPSVLTETHLPDVDEPERGHRGEQGDHKDKDRDHKDGDRDHKDGDRDHKDGDRDHGGREHDHGGHDQSHGEVERGDVGDHGEIGEHGSGAKPVEEEHGGGGGQQHGGGGSHHGDPEDRH